MSWSNLALWIYILVPSVALVGRVAPRWRAGRWDDRAASMGLTLVIAALVTMAILVLAFGAEQDVVGWLLAKPGLISPLLLFVVLTLYSVMSFGTRLLRAMTGMLNGAGRGRCSTSGPS